jgi:hypothetical protein
VQHPLVRAAEPGRQLDGEGEEAASRQGGLAALVGGDHLVGRTVCGEELGQVHLVHLGRHAEGAAWLQLLLGQEEAVLAAEGAHRSGRLRHDMEGEARDGDSIAA